MWCTSCRVTGYIHCAHPDECGNMVTLTAAADSWKSWLDDAPLPETFNSATGGLQDFITALSRALLDARAELARVKADAAAAMALVVERAAENKEQLDIWAQEILEGLSFADVLKITSYDDKIEAHNIVGRGLVDVIRTLAPADALAEVQRLRVEARENAMQALASMGQAQDAYEAQLEAEAELATLRAQVERLTGALEACVASLERVDTAEGVCCCGDSMDRHSDPMSCGHSPVDMGDYYAGQALESARAALAPTPTDPGDGWTWNERLGWIGPDGKPADPRRRG